MDVKERLSDQPSQPLSEATADFQVLVENLAEPVVIMDRAGTIRFMNPRAERMLVLGLREQVEAYLGEPSHRQPDSQVRFRVDRFGEVILRIHLSSVSWQGRPALQVSLRNVTPYVAAAERLSQEIEKLKGGNGGSQKSPERLEAQLQSLAAERDSVYAASSQRLAQETARFQKSLEEAQAQRDRLEAQLKELAAEKERTEQSLRAELAQLREAAPKAEPATEELVQARRSMEELAAARRELEARTGHSPEEWASLRQLQAAAAEAESRLAAAQKQSAVEAEKSSAERSQARRWRNRSAGSSRKPSAQRRSRPSAIGGSTNR